MDSEHLEQLAASARDLAAEGLVERSSGNVSVRVGDEIGMTPTGALLARAEASDMVVLDRAGEQRAGTAAPTSEAGLHLALYARYDCGAVVHTHAPAATALACVVDELPVVHYEQLLLGGAIRVAPFEAFGTDALAAAAADAIEGRTVALLANHGTIALGPDLDAAVRATQLLEWLSRLYLQASVVGTPRPLTEEQAQDVVAAAVARNYGGAR
jgi:L-fuculose-phosphate aldolase